ncbi:MAG: tRNA (adenosine(37)-N6)-threonylcarbamoyltransferase complex ATPase subunit type 1 TsaE [Candidatus Omnitrophota bacterium]|nr:MAG: tRNA (adenosine(37)-N6)-threonylcarbamoyltransferase complex ATPase subunit type 1 TsaE [Candidatus Omnitrophota bacterium]
MKIITNCADQTIELGRRFAHVLEEKDVVVFTGALGGGKTTFIKGVLSGLGRKVRVVSPSFTLVRHYRAQRIDIYHIDLYRLDEHPEIFGLGIEDYLYAPSSIVLVEWGEKIEELLPRYIKIAFFYESQDSRRIVFSSEGYDKRRFDVLRKEGYSVKK